MKNQLFTLFLLFFSFLLNAQPKPLTYYLPDISYDKDIPTPESVLNYQVGEWHITHDQLVHYMRTLAEASERITLQEYGRTYENRPLLLLTITSKKNHEKLPEIQEQHLSLSDPALSSEVNVSKMPIVVYQGYSIHGNEPSGSNAAVLMAYYLAAGKSRELERLLEDAVILLDPCYNPDGLHRFSTWVNMHKSKNLVSDPQSREFSEVWPGARTNHYWFDLNRDWLPVQHPESKGRLQVFHEWKPNVLTDHHEMGSNSTFFFQPGVPKRTNPNTPIRNQELTAKIGEYHAAQLDEIGSLYFSQERFDDFYYGKGSTYPDINGCIGILFEQASSRGHLQETIHGEMSFAFTIRNQIATSFSTLKAASEMREELLDYQKVFYQTALEEARGDNDKAYVISKNHDNAKFRHFLEILRTHQIQVHRLNNTLTIDGKNFSPTNAYIVPLEQPQYRLIKAIFETNTSFRDSLFYDISTWTLPLAFNLDYAEVSKRDFSSTLLGSVLETLPALSVPAPDYSEYAYLFRWDEYYAPKALYYLLKNDLRIKVSTQSFTIQNKTFEAGTILIPVKIQDKSPEEIHQLILSASHQSNIAIYDMDTGLSPKGIDLGSSYFRSIELPKVMLVVGSSVSSNAAGEVWHLLDQRYDMQLSMLQADNVGRYDLNKYNTIILVNGSYGNINAVGITKLKIWIQNGGTLIAMKNAISWAKSKGLAFVEFKKSTPDNKKVKKKERRPYGKLQSDRGATYIGGAIFESELDLTHPLGYGFHQSKLPVFRRGNHFMEQAKNVYATPLVYTGNPLLSGYLNKKNNDLVKNSAGIVVSGLGSGKVICMADDLNFRAFWYGTNKIFANAIFFGPMISSAAAEKMVQKKK